MSKKELRLSVLEMEKLGISLVFPQYRDAEAEANSRRVVACLNACAGISTENLKDNLPVKELADRYNAVLKQRDMLLDVLESIGHKHGCHKNAFGEECTCGIDAAISRVKGGCRMTNEDQRQLVELAAKSVGCINQSQWNPLEDDGAALRLAVKLGLCVAIFPKDHETMVGYPKGEHDGGNIIESHNSDPFAATRRAIVMAAAEIGRKMGDTE